MKERTTWLRPLLATCLVAVYVLSFIQKGHVHLHHHAEHQHELHDDHCAEDACHVSIYHLGVKGCDHKAHLIPAEEVCYDCHEILQIQFFEELPTTERTQELSTLEEFMGMDLCELFDVQRKNDRGPPAWG